MTPSYLAASEPVARLIERLNKLPGIGPKSAQRLAYYLLRASPEEAAGLAEAILAVKEKMSLCSVCFNITETDPCHICRDTEREAALLCVVEEPSDIIPLERTRKYRGFYHVLHGVISPQDGIGPDHLKFRELFDRVAKGGFTEVIIATNPTTEGEATAMYLQESLEPLKIRLTRLARGLPYGGELEYADDVTLSRAMEGRQPL